MRMFFLLCSVRFVRRPVCGLSGALLACFNEERDARRRRKEFLVEHLLSPPSIRKREREKGSSTSFGWVRHTSLSSSSPTSRISYSLLQFCFQDKKNPPAKKFLQSVHCFRSCRVGTTKNEATLRKNPIWVFRPRTRTATKAI